MNPDLALIADELEIRRVLARYCRGVDRLDERFVEACFWPSQDGSPAVFAGTFGGTPREWVEFIFKRMRQDLITTHHLGQSLIEIDGGNAEVETYFQSRHAYADEGDVTVMVVSGRYADRFEKRDSEWRIASRTLIFDLRRFDRGLGQAKPGEPWSPIGRRSDDPSFELRLLGANNADAR